MTFSPAPRFRIMATKADGSTFECFTWTRSSEEGIARAKADAREHGVAVDYVWAETIME